jgi:hypothetical protein
MSPFFRSRTMTVILVAACAWLLLIAAGASLRSLGARGELRALEGTIDDRARGNDRLGRELERMRQSSWLALLARARLNWKAPDETVVFVYKSEKSDTIVQPQTGSDQRPNWRKWWDWLHRRD